MKQFLSYAFGLFFVLTTPVYSLILIDDTMTEQEQEKTGVSKLDRSERYALEQWLNKNFTEKKEEEKATFGKDLYVSEIINHGQQLRLSDNSLYEIAPDDWERTQAWIGGTSVNVTYTDDPYYPWTITNPISGYSVSARLIDTDAPVKQEAPEPKSQRP